MEENSADENVGSQRQRLIDAGWRRGVCVNLKNDDELTQAFIRSLPALITDMIEANPRVFLLPLLFDCALIDDDHVSEPWSQVIICCEIDGPLGNFQNGKNPRRYHFELDLNGEKKWFEATAAGLWTVCRKDLVALSLESNAFCSEINLDRILKWAASRITRSVFPDEWNRKIQPIQRRLETIWKSDNCAFISQVMLSIVEVENGYQASLLLSVAEDSLGDQKRSYFSTGGAASILESKIKTTISAVPGVEVINVSVLPESQITLGMLRRYKSWSLDYFSFRRDPEGVTAVV